MICMLKASIINGMGSILFYSILMEKGSNIPMGVEYGIIYLSI